MTSMSSPTWPPSEDLLRFRPTATTSESTVGSWQLVDADPDGPAGDHDLPAYCLAEVLTDAGRPGGGGISVVYAVPRQDGALHVVITNDDEIRFTSPIKTLAELRTLGELLTILDETLIDDDEPMGVGHPTRLSNDLPNREDLRGFLTIASELYPQLHELDESRFERWVAEGSS